MALTDTDARPQDPAQDTCPWCWKPLPDAPPAGSRDAHVPRACPVCGGWLPQEC